MLYLQKKLGTICAESCGSLNLNLNLILNQILILILIGYRL